jgi:Cu/Ag efflux pump CusA
VLVLPNGATLTLGDVAQIEESFEPPHERAFVDGAPAIVIDVANALEADALRVLDSVAALVAEETARLLDTITVEVVQDVTSIIRDRLVMLVQNGVIGLVLVVAVMSLFFRPGFAIWAAMGLPVAFAAAFVWMALTGLSLNMMTRGSFVGTHDRSVPVGVSCRSRRQSKRSAASRRSTPVRQIPRTSELKFAWAASPASRLPVCDKPSSQGLGT